MDPTAKPFQMGTSHRVSERDGQRELRGTHADGTPRRTASIMSIGAILNDVSIDETLEDKSVKTLAKETEALTFTDWEIVESPEASKLQAINPKTNAAQVKQHPRLEVDKPGQPSATEMAKDKHIEYLEMDNRRLVAMINWHSDTSIKAQKEHDAKEEMLSNQIAAYETKLERLETYLEYEFALNVNSIPLEDMDDIIDARERMAKAGPIDRTSDLFW